MSRTKKADFLKTKVLIASLYNGRHRDVTNKILQNYAASRIETVAMANPKIIKSFLPRFYNNLVRLPMTLKRPNPTQEALINIKNDILKTMPRPIMIPNDPQYEILRNPTLIEKMNTLKEKLKQYFTPDPLTCTQDPLTGKPDPLTCKILYNSESVDSELIYSELIDLAQYIIKNIHDLVHTIAIFPPIPYRQTATIGVQLGEGKKRKTRRKNSKTRRKNSKRRK